MNYAAQQKMSFSPQGYLLMAVIWILALFLIGVPLTASASGNDATGREYIAKESINGGEPVKLTYWEWSGQRAEYQQRWADAYMALYPNVEIEIVLQPWGPYWSSLITNVPAGKGPSMWHMHASKMTEFCEGKLMDSIPDTVADPEFLSAQWIGFAEGAMSCPGSGSLHTVPMGAMMPLLFINLDMWEAAGLTDDDLPTSWEELRAVSKKLTQRDGRGRIQVAGLSVQGQEWLQNAVYQQGRYLFNPDGATVQVSNPEYKSALQFLSDLVHTDEVLDQEIASLGHKAFVSEQAAMYIGFSWISGFINNNKPDMNWRGALLPTPDGKLEPAYGNIRFALEAVVNPYAPDAERAVAWDFWHFNYSNETVILEDLALFNGFVPPYKKLTSHPKVQENQVVSTITSASEFGVINDLPNVVRDEQIVLIEAVMLSAEAVNDNALSESESAQNELLSKRDNWNIIERNYSNKALMLPEQ